MRLPMSFFGNSRAAVVAAILAVCATRALAAQRLLVPMDDAQQNHLKAYGLAYNAIKAGASAEWILNYRGGSFLLADTPELRRQAGLMGISLEPMDNARVGQLRAEIAANNMEAVPLEKAPKVAVYTPSEALPWDDAVTLALKYAGIEYTPIYDDEVERGDLSKYDWLHLHHEDFTGQLNKFYLTYRDAPWFIDLLQKNTASAKRLGFANMPGSRRTSPKRFASSSSAAVSCSRCAVRPRHSSWRSPAATSTLRRVSSMERRWTPTPTRRWIGGGRSRSTMLTSSSHRSSIR